MICHKGKTRIGKAKTGVRGRGLEVGGKGIRRRQRRGEERREEEIGVQGEQGACGRSVRPGGGRNLPGERNITKGGFSLSSVSPVSYIRLSATCFSVNFRRPGKHRGLYLSPSIFFLLRGEQEREGRRIENVASPLFLPRLLWEGKKGAFAVFLLRLAEEQRGRSVMCLSLDQSFS